MKSNKTLLKTIIKSFVEAINEVLGGHSDLKDTLESSRFLISQSSEKSNYTSWVLNDGSIVRNIVHSKTKPRSTMPWIGTNLKTTYGFRYSYNLNKEMEGKRKEVYPRILSTQSTQAICEISLRNFRMKRLEIRFGRFMMRLEAIRTTSIYLT